jgi:hypothetical protein
MLTRRRLITAGTSLALTGSGLGLNSFRASAASINLPAALPEGARNNAVDCVEVCPVDCFYEGENMCSLVGRRSLITFVPVQTMYIASRGNE